MKLLDLVAQRKLEGRRTFQGLNISIETDAGSERVGVYNDKAWRTVMKVPYGYIRMTEGVDGDHVDCFIGPNEQATHAYVIHQKRPDTGAFDEDKVVLGVDSARAARELYFEHYDEPEKFFGGIEAIPMRKFKEKVLATKGHPKKIAASSLEVAILMSSQLIVLSGLPGAGKTTYAGKLVQRSKGAKIISRDDIRIPGESESECSDRLLQQARKLLNSGTSVIIDSPNLEDSDRHEWSALAKETGAEFKWVDLNTPVAVCIARDANRPGSIGPGKIMEMARAISRRNVGMHAGGHTE